MSIAAVEAEIHILYSSFFCLTIYDRFEHKVKKAAHVKHVFINDNTKRKKKGKTSFLKKF